MSDREYWERHARKYDASLRVLGRPFPRMLELVTQAVAGRERVLEVAAGTGLVTSALARAARNVVATDYAQAMVDMLRERVREAGLTNVECEAGDIYALKYPAGSFDAVVAANVLHLVPDLAGALAALARVLKPDGRLVLPTFCHDQTRLSWVVSRALAVTGFPGHRRFTLASLQRSLQEAKIRIERSEVIPGLIPIGYVEGTSSPEG